MQETLLSLYRLQQIDLKALELERAAQQIPEKISELESEPDPIRGELGEMNTELEGLRTIRVQTTDYDITQLQFSTENKTLTIACNELGEWQEFHIKDNECVIGLFG